MVIRSFALIRARPAEATPTFNDNRVREVMLVERQAKERETYLQTLRNEAFIKVTEAYKAGVDPLLKIQGPRRSQGRRQRRQEKVQEALTGSTTDDTGLSHF